MTSSQQLRENLLQTDEEFRQLAEQHHELDTRISELSRQLYRTGNEELEKGPPSRNASFGSRTT